MSRSALPLHKQGASPVLTRMLYCAGTALALRWYRALTFLCQRTTTQASWPRGRRAYVVGATACHELRLAPCLEILSAPCQRGAVQREVLDIRRHSMLQKCRPRVCANSCVGAGRPWPRPDQAWTVRHCRGPRQSAEALAGLSGHVLDWYWAGAVVAKDCFSHRVVVAPLRFALVLRFNCCCTAIGLGGITAAREAALFDCTRRTRSCPSRR